MRPERFGQCEVCARPPCRLVVPYKCDSCYRKSKPRDACADCGKKRMLSECKVCFICQAIRARQDPHVVFNRGQKQDEAAKKCRAAFALRYRTDPEFRAKKLNAQKKSAYISKYGICPEQASDLLTSQKGTCKICEMSCSFIRESGTPFGSAVVDHCHKTGKVRGILCGRCNAGLGQFADSPANLARAAVYLERFYAQA